MNELKKLEKTLDELLEKAESYLRTLAFTDEDYWPDFTYRGLPVGFARINDTHCLVVKKEGRLVPWRSVDTEFKVRLAGDKVKDKFIIEWIEETVNPTALIQDYETQSPLLRSG